MEDISFTWKEVDGREVEFNYIGKTQKMDILVARLAKKKGGIYPRSNPMKSFPLNCMAVKVGVLLQKLLKTLMYGTWKESCKRLRIYIDNRVFNKILRFT